MADNLSDLDGTAAHAEVIYVGGRPISSANPMPVSIVGGGGGGSSGAVTDSASEASLAVIAANVATASGQSESQVILSAILAKQAASPALDGTDATGVTAPTGAVGVRGWLSGIYDRLGRAMAVTGTFWQATQPVSVAATLAVIDAPAGVSLVTIATNSGAQATSALQASGNASATIIATQTTASSAATGNAADAAYATGSGSIVSVLKGIFLKLAGILTVSTPDVRLIDQLIPAATLNAAFTIALNAQDMVGITVSGLTASGATLTLEATNNIGAAVPIWAGVNCIAGSTLYPTITTDGNFRVETGARTGVRLRVSTVGTGNITISANSSATSGLVTLAQSIPAGTNTIGAVLHSGGTPIDYSANPMAVPLAGYVLIATAPVNATRGNIEVVNHSGAQIQIVLDDGLGTAGTISSVLLAGGVGAPSQGGSWSDMSFKGRARIYAPLSTAIVTVRTV